MSSANAGFRVALYKDVDLTTIVDVVSPTWTVENINIDSTNKKVTADIKGTDKYLDVENSGITADDITLTIDGETVTSVTKTLSNVTALVEKRDGIATQYGISYTLTLENFEESTFQTGKSYMEWSGATSISIPAGKLVDESGNTSSAKTASLGQVDFIKPKIKYTYSEADINKTNKTVKVVFSVTDKYFSNSTLTANDLTILVDGENPGSAITKTLTSTDITATVNGTSKTVGKTYTLTLSNLEQTSIASGKNYLDYSGTITIAIPAGKITDTSSNSNDAKTLTIGINDTGEGETDDEGNWKSASDLFDENGSNANGLHIGDFVDYDAGTWTQEEIEANSSLSGSTNLPTSGLFGGFAAGSSRNGNATPYSTTYNYVKDASTNAALTGWRIFDINDDGTVTLISAGNPEDFYPQITGGLDDENGFYETYLTTMRDWIYYVNTNQKAQSATVLTKDVLDNWYDKYMGTVKGDTVNDTYDQIYSDPNYKYQNIIDNYSHYYIATAYGTGLYTFFPDNRIVFDDWNKAYGLRVLITLSQDALFSAEKTGTKTVTGGNTTSYGGNQTYNCWEIKTVDEPSYIPEGYTHAEGTMDTGYVIQDSTGNQFVWVEVPQTTSVYPTAGLSITSFTDEELTKIETDLQTYTSAYKNKSYVDEFPSDKVEAATGLTSTEYSNLKKKMLKSVYQYGGFYIGRYETGIEGSYRDYGTNWAVEHPITETPVIKANVYPYNNVRASQAQTLSASFSTSGYQGSLMFGVQYDLVLKYLETKGVSQADLNTNSTSWANNETSTYNITNTQAKYNIINTSTDSTDSKTWVYSTWQQAPYSKTGTNYVLLTTGASDTFAKQNIYDLAGNVSEWTLENPSVSYDAIADRGGSMYRGDDKPASYRINNPVEGGYLDIGFRTALYKNSDLDSGSDDSDEGSIVDVVDPIWTVENINIDSANKKISVDIIGTDKYLDVENSGITADDITLTIDGETATSVTKTLSSATVLTEDRDGIATQYGISYTLTFSNFEEGTFQSGKSYMEWSGATSITIPAGKLVDENDNASKAKTVSLVTVDWIKPKIKYTYSEADINKTNKTVKVVFSVTDKYFSNSTLTADDLTILVDGENPGSAITKILTSTDITATVNGTSKTVGKTYTLTLSNLEQTSIASGKNYLDYSGIITIAIPAGKIKDQEQNSNDAKTLTIGIDEIGDAEPPSYIPTGYTHIEGTLDTGYVIQDSTGNQFVWVEVPQTTTVYPTAGLNITEFTSTELTAIETDLQTYTSAYKDEYHSDTYDSGLGLTETEYYEQKEKMLKSIYTYGGFYVGRYETGISYSEGYRRTNDEEVGYYIDETPVIKANSYPYNNVKVAQAQELSESFATAGYTTSLMYGVQWDLIIKHLENNGVTQAELKSDSTSWGNYENNLYTITNTNSKYSTDGGTTWTDGAYGEKGSSTGVLLTTGASNSFSKMGIYDLSGNVDEWTLESYSDFTGGTNRGGYCGSNKFMSYRDGSDKDSFDGVTGFRVSLYKDPDLVTSSTDEAPIVDVVSPTWKRESTEVNVEGQTASITFTGTDKYYDEDYALTASNIKILIDGTEVTSGITKTLSTPTALMEDRDGDGTAEAKYGERYTLTFSGFSSSVEEIKVRMPAGNLTDANGNTSVETTWIVYPGLRVAATPASAKDCKSATVTISATESDAGLSASNSYQYYLSTSSTALAGGAWTNYTSGTAFTIGTGKTGTYYLFVKTITDNDGLVSTEAGTIVTIGGTNYHRFGAYEFDNTEPTVTVSPTSAEWCKTKDVTITLADTGPSGVSSTTGSYFLSTSTAPTAVPTDTSVSGTFTSGTAKTIGTGLNGQYYLYVKAITDKAGNASTTAGTLVTVNGEKYHRFGIYKFDNDLPQVTYVSKDIYYLTANDAGNDDYANKERTVDITFKVTDATSNITSTLTASDITATVNGTAMTNKTLTTVSTADKTITYKLTIKNITGDGTLNLVVGAGKVTDQAGNTNVQKTLTTDVNITIDNTSPSLSFAVTSPTAGYYKAGQVVTITATYNEDVYKEITSNNLIDTTAEAPTMALTFGGANSVGSATCSSVSGKVITYTYTIQTGDNGSLAIKSLGTVYDHAGNAISASNVTPSTSIIADTILPTITLGENSNTTWAKTHSVTVTLADERSGLTAGASIKYGWSTSNTTAPTSYTTATLSYTAGASSTTFTAQGSGITGQYYLWVVPTTLKDVAGNAQTENKISTGTFYFDNINPTITVNTTSCTWRNSALSTIITATDTGGSELATTNSYQYYLSNSATALSGGEWKTYTSGTAVNISPKDNVTGTYYLFVKTVSDNAGNVSETNGTMTTVSSTTYHRFGEYKFDYTTPTITLGANSNTTWAKTHSVTVTLADAHSGLATGAVVKYGWSTSNTTAPATANLRTATISSYTAGTGSATFTAEGTNADGVALTGKYYLWVIPTTLKDVAGNSLTTNAISTGTFYFDNKAPTPGTMTMKYGSASGANYTSQAMPNETWSSQSIYVAVNNGSDEHSGHASTTYTVKKDGVVLSGHENITGAKTLDPGTGNHAKYEIVVTTKDVVGNTATSSTYYVYIDKKVPTVTYQYNSSDIDTTGKTVKVVFSVTDDYYASGTLALSDLTIKLDKDDSTEIDLTNNTDVTKTLTSEAVIGTVDGTSKTIGYQYTLTLSNLEKLYIDEGDKYANYSGVISVGIPAGKIADKAGNTNNATTITMGIDLPSGTGSEVVADVVDPIIQKVTSTALAKSPSDAVNTNATTGTATLEIKATDKYIDTSSTLTNSDIEVYVDGTKTTTATVNVTKNTVTQASNPDYFEQRTADGTTTTSQIGVKHTITVSGWKQGAKQVKVKILADSITDKTGNGNKEIEFIVYNTLELTSSETASDKGFLGSASDYEAGNLDINIQRKQIENVTFMDNFDSAPITVAGDGTIILGSNCWDVSAQGDKSIIAWHSTGDAPYTVYIASEDEIFANPNSSYLFRTIGYVEDYTDTATQTLTNLSLLNTSSVTNMNSMFAYCGYTSMTSLDLSSLNTANATNMAATFSYCGYRSLTSLDVSSFNTANVTTMARMFENCGEKAMSSFNLGDNFDTSNVTDMSLMFENCGWYLTSLDLGDKFDTSKVTNMSRMFNRCWI